MRQMTTRSALGLTGIVVTVAVAFSLGACGAGGEEERDTARETTARDWQPVGEALGKKGELEDGGVYSVSWPRSDLKVRSEGITIEPALALGSHAEFLQVGDDEALMRGDLVLTEDEFNRVIARLQEGGVGQTAIHKHLLDQSPAIWWTHISGRGDPLEIARTVRAALELSDTPLGEAQPKDPGRLALDTQRLDEIMGIEGKAAGGVYKFSVPRPEEITVDGVKVPSAMGTAMPLNFQPTGAGRAAINGDFVMRAEEVDSVVRMLREADIKVVALHNHFLTDEPRLFFLHFWADGDAETLARGLRRALEQTKAAP